ncbi:MAG TPA: EamA family transporter [Terriglobales bacterium]|jgi:drug/metabolite transporter (DMT)-like permease|nr:EamA family transporter [Terriglobales bacterium]
MTNPTPASRWKIILAFGLVYVFWGSTYLGIGIAVEQIPPGVMCATRFLIAGTVMLAYCGLTGRRILFPPRQLGHLAAVGILLLMGGNLTLSYAEQIVPTGLAALLIAVTPLWFLVLDSLLLGDHHISRRGKIGLAIGIAGVVVLIWPDLLHPNSLGRRELWWSLALQLGSFSWAFGSVLSKKWQTAAADPFSAIAWQVFFAGIANLIFALLVERHTNVTWSFRGVAAILYLVVCGSWIGYTAYIWLLQHVPTSKVSTYAYVNPVVAIVLGWLVLHERVDRYILIGSAIVVASVVLVTSAKVSSRSAAEELPAVEAAGD